MSLINPWDSKKGLKEKVNQMEGLLYKHEGLIRTLIAKFETERKFFDEVTKSIQAVKQPESPATDKHDNDNPSSSDEKVQP